MVEMSMNKARYIDLFKDEELSLKKYWLGPRSQEVGWVEGQGGRRTIPNATVTSRKKSVLKRAAMRVISMFHQWRGGGGGGGRGGGGGGKNYT